VKRADRPESLQEPRHGAAHILSVSDLELADFVSRKCVQRQLTHVVQLLNGLAAEIGEDQELGLRALRRMGLESAGK
jgi:hypothetical protein